MLELELLNFVANIVVQVHPFLEPTDDITMLVSKTWLVVDRRPWVVDSLLLYSLVDCGSSIVCVSIVLRRVDRRAFDFLPRT